MTHSMTAFARVSDQGDWGMATWEIRSVNHRYFECSFRLPEIMRNLEITLRPLMQQQLNRGKIECNLRFIPGEQSGLDLTLNLALVKKLTQAVTAVKECLPTAAAIDPLKILAWPQVLQTTEENVSVVTQKIQDLFKRALDEIIAARSREGAALQQIILTKLQQLPPIIEQVKQQLPQILANQRQKLLERLQEIRSEVDPQRLEQEMVILAQRMDVAEELERLATHAREIQRVLTSNGNIGKRLDFLMQELNREANTLASKSIAISTTNSAVSLKVLIEEMREQIQNIV